MIRTTFTIAAFVSLAASAALAGSGDKQLDLYWIDVEGGAATLLVTPAGESILLDTGNLGRRDPERIVKVAGEVAGLKQIDHLVITHYHGDHFGGAITLADLLPIKNLYDNGKFEKKTDCKPGSRSASFQGGRAGSGKEEYRRGNCEIKREWKENGEYKEEVKCDRNR